MRSHLPAAYSRCVLKQLTQMVVRLSAKQRSNESGRRQAPFNCAAGNAASFSKPHQGDIQRVTSPRQIAELGISHLQAWPLLRYRATCLQIWCSLQRSGWQQPSPRDSVPNPGLIHCVIRAAASRAAPGGPRRNSLEGARRRSVFTDPFRLDGPIGRSRVISRDGPRGCKAQLFAKSMFGRLG